MSFSFCALLFCMLSHSVLSSHSLRVMTFNIWLSGGEVENGLQKIAKHILLVNPDVVALQEVENMSVVSNLTRMMGPDWSGLCHGINESYPDTAILTKHTFHHHSLTHTNWSMGVLVSLDSGQMLHFWSAHLDYRSYGPYAANNKMVTKVEQILAGEKPQRMEGRCHNMMEVRNNEKMRKWMEKSHTVPIIFAGDFNCPSHLDWGDDMKHEHGGWVVPWPATVILEDMGFMDSFRELHPDPSRHPGTTWSTVNKFNPEWDYTIPEPQDRIDFIFYKGSSLLSPTHSFTYRGGQPLLPIPDHAHNDYPSDHYAVVTDFHLLY